MWRDWSSDVCSSDLELSYLETGHSSYPLRPGHEWCGRVTGLGDGVDPAWLGRRVMGATMPGDRVCRRCPRGDQHVCDQRQGGGIRGGPDGALTGQIAVPAGALHELPVSVDAVLVSLVEAGGNARRASRAAAAWSGYRALVMGPVTIGLLTAMFLRAAGAAVLLLGTTEPSLAFARGLGVPAA